MNIRETVKEKTLRLIGLILITIPLLACYPMLLHLGLSIKIATILTICLSIIAYILLVTHIEPFLGRILPFLSPKTVTQFTSARLEQGDVDVQIAKGPSSHSGVSDLDVSFQSIEVSRDPRGNWVHS